MWISSSREILHSGSPIFSVMCLPGVTPPSWLFFWSLSCIGNGRSASQYPLRSTTRCLLFIVSLIHNDILKEDRISLDVFSRPWACSQRPHSASKINPVGLFLILLKESSLFCISPGWVEDVSVAMVRSLLFCPSGKHLGFEKKLFFVWRFSPCFTCCFSFLWKWHWVGHLLKVRREAQLCSVPACTQFPSHCPLCSRPYRNHVATHPVDGSLTDAWRNCSVKKSLVVGDVHCGEALEVCGNQMSAIFYK